MKKDLLGKGKLWLVVLILVCFLSNSLVFAADSNSSDDLDAAIKAQQALLVKLSAQKAEKDQAAQAKIDGLVNSIKALQDIQTRQQKMQEDMKLSLDAIQIQLADKNNLSNQQGLMNSVAAVQQQQAEFKVVLESIRASQQDPNVNTQQGIIDSLVSLQQQFNDIKNNQLNKVYAPAVTAPVMSENANTQDAIAAERDAEMNFAYVPGGMYKIYCKKGFLTDIRLRPGEEITFVGGGDTAKWVIDTANTGSGNNKVAHLYIKPIKDEASTNLIINTTNHSYQILIKTADWYNPIVNWTYSSEEQLAGKIAQAKDESFFTEKNISTSRPENLNFDYKVKNGKEYRWAPKMVFDDGQKTFIKMPNSMSQGNAPVLFIKERGRKALSLVNYRIKDNYYIVDRLFDEAALKVSEKELVKIVRGSN